MGYRTLFNIVTVGPDYLLTINIYYNGAGFRNLKAHALCRYHGLSTATTKSYHSMDGTSKLRIEYPTELVEFCYAI